jgi:predicted helicase
LTEILPINNVGIVTARDALTIHFEKNNVWDTVDDFASLPPEEARTKYELGKDAQDWKVPLAQKDLNESGPTKDRITPILYRPYDVRYTYYTGNSRGFHCRARSDVMRHMLTENNLALITTRQTRDEWHVLASNKIVGHKSLAGYDINTLFPLYVYPTLKKGNLLDEVTRRANLDPGFISDFSERLKLTLIPEGNGDGVKTFGPEDVFDYMYAVFHSPTYRSRYAQFLKIDFPRLPLTSNAELFRGLCALGSELVGLHLMEHHAPAITTYPITGDNEVEKVRYTAPGEGGSDEGRVWINREQYFEGVPPEVWNFHVGGYQVCQKWLKDRKGRKLTYDDLTHYQRIVSALNETIRLMSEIDTLIEEHGGWPIS